MLKELYTAAMGMLPQETKLEVAANNIANANTPGFKRESVFARALIDASAHLNDTPNEAGQNDPPIGAYTDYSTGAFQQTNNPLDLAIDNENGFFVVQDGAGKQFLTRAGHFNLSDDGILKTPDGKELTGADKPIGIQKQFSVASNDVQENTSVNIRIDENGEIFANQQLVGAVQVVKIENPETLQRYSNTEFIATDGTNQDYLPQEEVRIKQGWLENSNVDIVKEMVKLIELQRMFEVGSKVIKANDETLDQSMKLGRIT